MKTRFESSVTSRRKRRAIADLFRTLDTLIAAAQDADRAKRIIVGQFITESDGKLIRGDDPRLTKREDSCHA